MNSLANFLRFLGLATYLCVVAEQAASQEERSVENPPEYLLTPSPEMRVGSLASAAVDGLRDFSLENEVSLEMNIEMIERRIYNPSTGSSDSVVLRGYSDPKASDEGPDTPLVGPTLSAVPGQTIRIRLNNRLDPEPTCAEGGKVNVPHCFNTTNLHSHGLWVNPAGNGDNVLLSIRPGVSFDYEYNIPSDRPAGTFWYHPHLHGSAALQVSSGMAGALIVRAERPPLVGTDGQIVQPGDLDLLLRAPDGQPLAEKVLVLQQIQYACLDANGQIEVVPDGPDKGHYICKEGQVGGINQYGPQFGPGTWPNSGRYTSINRAVLGSLGQATVGSVERWRFIHAGVRDTINLQILHKTSDVSLDDVTRADGNWIDQNCGAPINFHVVAQDGLTMAAAQKRTQSVLQPGYRVDALVSFPQAGDYCIIDAATPPAGSVNQDESDRRLLGMVSATGDATPAMAADDYLQNWLLAAAERNIPEDARQRVTDDLRDGLKLSAFVPHPDIQKDEVTGEQTLVFNIDTSQTPPVFEVNGQPYDPNRIDRQLVVGGVDEWTLTSDLASHPFHIHVNPFQIVSILDPDGKDVSLPDSTDGSDPQYAGRKAAWKDTLFVKNAGGGKKYTVTIRTRYQRYIGEFVLHCHILDHEDQGMMQNVQISLPDGAGGAMAMGHH